LENSAHWRVQLPPKVQLINRLGCGDRLVLRFQPEGVFHLSFGQLGYVVQKRLHGGGSVFVTLLDRGAHDFAVEIQKRLRLAALPVE